MVVSKAGSPFGRGSVPLFCAKPPKPAVVDVNQRWTLSSASCQLAESVPQRKRPHGRIPAGDRRSNHPRRMILGGPGFAQKPASAQKLDCQNGSARKLARATPRRRYWNGGRCNRNRLPEFRAKLSVDLVCQPKEGVTGTPSKLMACKRVLGKSHEQPAVAGLLLARVQTLHRFVCPNRGEHNVIRADVRNRKGQDNPRDNPYRSQLPPLPFWLVGHAGSGDRILDENWGSARGVGPIPQSGNLSNR